MKDFKTTIVGLALGILIAVQPMVQNGEFNTAKDWLNLIIGIAISALGFLSKDSDDAGANG
jgi:hypothetical protein